MSLHSYSRFTNSCLKLPVNPSNKQPIPKYERPPSYLNNEMEALQINDIIDTDKGTDVLSDFEDKSYVQYLTSFYESIPDYCELNHLSERDFYAKIDSLKETCSRLKNYSVSMNSLDRFSTNHDKYTRDSVETSRNASRQCSSKSYRNKSEKSFQRLISKSLNKNFNSNGNRSKSASPIRSYSNPAVNNKPNKLSTSNFSEKEDQIFENYFKMEESQQHPKTYDDKKFKANPVPYTSKVPLYNQIIKEQELRSKLAKLNSAIELQSKMKPFQFNEGISRCGTAMSNCQPMPKRSYIPKSKSFANRSSNNLNNSKMWEAEYFKNLNHHIRAEEMLKNSTYPMTEKRNKADKQDLGLDAPINITGSRRKKKIKHKLKKGNKDNLSTFLIPSSLKENNKMEHLSKHDSDRIISPITPIYPAARPNLAATLRREVSKKKIRQTCSSASSYENIQRRFDWGVRKTPAWKSLGFNETNDEDISFRLATRKAEQRLRQEEYQLNMEIMRQRVKAAPLLLEGDNMWDKVMKTSHNCINPQSGYAQKQAKKRQRKSNCNQRRSAMSNESNDIKISLSNNNKDADSDDLCSQDRAFL